MTRPDEPRDTEALLSDPALRMVNRNRGSGTRVLIDELLGERRPPGHAYEPRSHYAVAAAVAPPSSSSLYCVSRNDGTHQFSSSYAEHSAAVNRFQKRRRGRASPP